MKTTISQTRELQYHKPESFDITKLSATVSQIWLFQYNKTEHYSSTWLELRYRKTESYITQAQELKCYQTSELQHHKPNIKILQPLYHNGYELTDLWLYTSTKQKIVNYWFYIHLCTKNKIYI